MLSLFCLLALPSISKSEMPIALDGMLCHPRNLLVHYDARYGAVSLKRAGYVVLRDLPQIDYAVVQAPVNRLQETRARLRGAKGIQAVGLDRAAKLAYTPNDPMWPDMWHMRAIKADLAWDATKGDSSVIVAVIDTGLDTGHPDIEANVYVNPWEIAGNGVDDDGNGYVDDVKGWDFAYGDNETNDVLGHGTACSGLVAAVQDNSTGVTGVAPRSRVMPLKTCTNEGFLFDSANIPAYLYAADNGAKVLSMSYYSDRVSPAERAGIEYCWSKGIVPVAAAGNDATVYSYYPGAYERVLSVAALDGNLNKAGFSDYGSWVDVAAPGVSLRTITAGGGYTDGFGGTSGACPHVAGLAALCFAMKPGATNQEVWNAIEDTATLQSQAPYGEFSNYGMVNCELAVQRMVGGGAPTKPAVLRWVNTLRGPIETKTGQRRVSRAYGRGFGLPNVVTIVAGSTTITPVAQTRDYIDFATPQPGQPFTIFVNGVAAGTVDGYFGTNFIYPLAEASSPGATVNGNFFSTTQMNDGKVMTCSRRSDGAIVLQGTFRLAKAFEIPFLVVRRRYTGTKVGTESVQLYDWSSASYPYGSFVTLGSGPTPTTMTTTQFDVGNGARFLDDDRTMYFRIVTSDDLSEGAELELDAVFLH